MSDSTLELEWGDGLHKFALPIGQARELEDKRDAGLNRILQRLSGPDWKIDDIREVVRLGLIGGGQVKPTDAHLLCVRYIDNRPFMESRLHAQAIVMKALVGDPTDQVGKSEADQETMGKPEMAEPPGPPTSDGEQSSASAPPQSTP
jgi:Phage tail tube protein, GTA-gp10